VSEERRPGARISWRPIAVTGLVVAIASLAAAGGVAAAYYVEGVDLGDVVFFAVAGLTVGCALYAVSAANIVRSVFSLLGTFFGVAGLYAMLAADFLAVVQVMVYVGGILVLMLFAVMLTSQISAPQESARTGGPAGVAGAAALACAGLTFFATLAIRAPWHQAAPAPFEPTTAGLGEALLGPALLPFEALSVVLLGVVIGAIVVARRRGSGPSSDDRSGEVE
jgi:NAD(P)H-quinone oxidoreductase subunit 6